MKNKFLISVLIFVFLIFSPTVSFSLSFSIANEDSALASRREALAMRVELNRLGSSGDPFEREAILRKIIDKSKGTEEAVVAYWDLADLYLDAFPEEMRKEAGEMLELCLKNYPDSPRAAMIKCKLIDLYDKDNPRREELINQLKNDTTLPNILKASLK